MNFKSITVKSIAAKLASLALIAGLLGASTMVSVSKDTLPTIINSWYDALKTADAKKFENLLSDDATIELKFLEITQTKQEFIDSLDEWKNANKDAVILTKLISSTAASTVVETCYRFPSNEIYGRETFTITSDKITSSVQEEISKLCPKF